MKSMNLVFKVNLNHIKQERSCGVIIYSEGEAGGAIYR